MDMTAGVIAGRAGEAAATAASPARAWRDGLFAPGGGDVSGGFGFESGMSGARGAEQFDAWRAVSATSDRAT